MIQLIIGTVIGIIGTLFFQMKFLKKKTDLKSTDDAIDYFRSRGMNIRIYVPGDKEVE